MKIYPVGAELFHADKGTEGRTDMKKVVVAFGNFANTPKMPQMWQDYVEK
jgi:hypothetical protein